MSATNSGRRSPLTRGRVVSVAVEFIDCYGLSELSMRRLGVELGVEAMALYRYVPSRENLLDAVVEVVVDELYADPQVHLLPRHSWQEYLVRLARGVRAMALAHPQVFPLVATRPPAAPWVRPPLRSLRWVESFLQGLIEAGFSSREAVYAYRAFSSFLLGHLLLEVSALGVDTGPIHEPDPQPPGTTAAAGTVDRTTYPLLVELAPKLSAYDFQVEFEDSLHNLLDRLGPGTATS